MFDSIKLGQYIQFLRKSEGLTQSRLAETLGVSHQAVSNWERGESMPDIALLSQIARALGTTVDRMLAAAEDFDKTKYEAFAAAEPAEPAEAQQPEAGGAPPEPETNEPKADEAEREADARADRPQEDFPDFNAAFRNLRDTVQDAVNQAVKSLDGFRGVKAVFSSVGKEIEDALEDAEEEIEELSEDLKDVKRKRRQVEINIRSASDSDEWTQIVEMAPFASPEALDRLVDKLDVKVDMRKLASVAPFLSEESLAKLIERALEGGDPSGVDALAGLAAFLDSDRLDQIVLRPDLKIDRKLMSRLAPFLSSEAVDELLVRLYSGAENPDAGG